MTDSDGDAPGRSRVVTCPHCGASVPDAPYCGACGARLAGARPGSARRAGARRAGAAARRDAYAAFPDHPVLRLAVVDSLLPQLGHHSRAAYRAAFALIVLA